MRNDIDRIREIRDVAQAEERVEGAALTMQDCPRAASCSVPICPLDRNWRMRTMTDDEATCFYLVESVKAGAQATFNQRGCGHLYGPMLAAGPDMSIRWGRIRRTLEQAAKSGSRLARVAPWERSE